MLMDLVHSPVKFYRDRIATSCLSMAMAALLLCMGLVAISAALATEKVKPLIEASMTESGLSSIGMFLTVSSAVGGGVTFAVMFLVQLFVLCCFYWFHTKPAQGTIVRLAEFAGVAAFVHVPALALNILALSLIDPASVPAGFTVKHPGGRGTPIPPRRQGRENGGDCGLARQRRLDRKAAPGARSSSPLRRDQGVRGYYAPAARVRRSPVGGVRVSSLRGGRPRR